MVFHPTWSTCRCVQRTVSIDVRSKPAAARSCRNGAVQVVPASAPRGPACRCRGRCRRRSAASASGSTSAWMLAFRRPCSSMKCGCSHRIGSTASRVACGQDEAEAARRLELEDLGDGHVADAPGLHQLTLLGPRPGSAPGERHGWSAAAGTSSARNQRNQSTPRGWPAVESQLGWPVSCAAMTRRQDPSGS